MGWFASFVNSKSKSLDKDVHTNRWWVWLAGICAVAVFGATMRAGHRLGAAVSVTIREAALWGVLTFVVFCPLFLLGRYIATRDYTQRQKEILTILIWALVVAVFLLPFVMVYVFGKN